MNGKSLPNFILEITVFVCGALVMIYEIIGSRILSPYIGTSTYTWTSLIGVILAALSLGYWLGGKWADKIPDVKILAFVIFIAGGLVGVTIFVKDFLLAFIAQNSLPLEIKSVLAALLLFAPASVFLGFVTPYAVKLKTKSLDETGETVGRLYALSTIGSIVGTFSAGFLLIPFVGSTRTLYLIAGSLFLLSVSLAPFAVTRLKIGLLIIFTFGILTNEGLTLFQRQQMNFRDIDTQYSRVQIFDTTHKKTGRQMRVMKIDPFIYQSSMFLDNGEPASEYHKYYHLIRHFKPDFDKTLMIGGAGYSFPKEYLETYPQAKIDVVEIDPQMTELAKKHFNLKKNPRLGIIHQDGRIFLNQAEPDTYDAVLLDAFTSLFSVPFHLTTIETVGRIDRVLREDGVVIFNIAGAVKGDAGRFLRAELATYRKVFRQVMVFKVAPEKPDTEFQNFIIVARQTDKPVRLESADAEISRLLSTVYQKEIALPTQILTDEYAPVEYYNSFAQSAY
jgi:spermidine synthase